MKLVKASIEQFKNFKPLYLSAFPKNEVKPVIFMKHWLKKDKYQLFYLDDNGVYPGFIIVVPLGDIVMFDYLAVDDKYKNKGYGSKILSLASELFKDYKRFLVIEEITPSAPNYAQRLARKNFYLKNDWNFTTLFSVGKGGRMHVLSQGEITPEDYIKVQRYALGKVLFKLSKMHLEPHEMDFI